MSFNNKLWGEIPALEYCKVSRAAELISCNIDDLFHWAAIGAIELCIDIPGSEFYLEWFKPGESEILKSGCLTSYTEFDKELSRIKKIKYTDEQCFEFIRNWLPPAYFDREGYLFPRPFISAPLSYVGKSPLGKNNQNVYFLNGLWAVVPAGLPYLNQYHKLMRYGSVTLFASESLQVTPADYDYQEHGKSIFQSLPEKSRVFERGDFYITRQQIEKIISNKGNILPSYVNGKVSNPTSSQKIHGNASRGEDTKRRFEEVLRLIVMNHRDECTGSRGKPTKEATARTFSKYQAAYHFSSINNIEAIKRKIKEHWDTLF